MSSCRALYGSAVCAFDVRQVGDTTTHECGAIVVQGLVSSPFIVDDPDARRQYSLTLPSDLENHPYPALSAIDRRVELTPIE